MLSPPCGHMPVLLRKPDSHECDAVLHDFEASLSSLVSNDENALQLTVVWQPWLKRGEIVSVVHSFPPRTRLGNTRLEKGEEGRVARIFEDEYGSVAKGRCMNFEDEDGDLWESGDALICFGGRNLWVPGLRICCLARCG